MRQAADGMVPVQGAGDVVGVSISTQCLHGEKQPDVGTEWHSQSAFERSIHPPMQVHPSELMLCLSSSFTI